MCLVADRHLALNDTLSGGGFGALVIANAKGESDWDPYGRPGKRLATCPSAPTPSKTRSKIG
ncbi:hypothetical protein HH1059_04270 [Halorhodospira halochloris]|uniref:Uncharacterized protein n=1 Tax=Halorhodospira halochloris TaxID=1052 RepID=A0A2Z6EZD6_HALHR|nr:hypothetical protein HH1059_04270 [Halorhodospira halochloris]